MPTFDITDEVVDTLGVVTVATATSGTGVPESMKWDCSIGGLPFLFFFDPQFPFRRETAAFRRDRVDTERNPGEQSLDSGFWLRSQASWHYGSGLSSAEPLEVSQQEAQFRYKTGGGVDPWTSGELSLLHGTSVVLSSAGTNQMLIGVDTGVLHADGTVVKYVTNAGVSSTVTWGGTGSVTSITTDGTNYYAADTTGIYKGTLPSSAGSLIWNTGGSALVRWVKGRLFASVGQALYELTSGGPTLPTALYTHPTSSWTWTDFAEGPSAIYAAGYAGDTSAIYKIDVTATASTVTLSQPTIVAEMPRGEKCLSLYSYLGSYMVVGTSKGARIATINNTYTSSGTLSMGPLVVSSTDGCLDAVADGSFIYVTVGSKGEAGNRVQRGGLYRIDLGTNLNQNALQFPSAADLVVPSGTSGAVTQVTTSGGKVWMVAQGSGVVKEATTYVAEGWLETGRIRMGTVENKAWRTLRILAKEGTTGTITGFAAVAEASAPSLWTQIISTPTATYDVTGSLNVVVDAPMPSMHVAFKLTTTDSSKTPTLTGWQVKAVPSPDRAELVSVPVLMYDWEVDRQGARYGGEGTAIARFTSLKNLEQSSSTVRFLDYTTGEAAEAFIEQVSLVRRTPPSKNYKGAGGVMTMLLRLV